MAKTPFKLKSGNKPTFKTMGSSTPLEMSRKSWKKNEEMRAEEDASTGSNADEKIKSDSDPLSPAKLFGLFKNKEDKENSTLTPEQMEAGANKAKAIKKKIVATGLGALTGAMDAVYGSGKVLPGQKAKPKDKNKNEKEEGNEDEENTNEESDSVSGTSTVDTEGVDKIINEE